MGASARMGVKLLIFAVLALAPAGAASAEEQAWVGGEVRVNLRTGASTGHRILGVLETGDPVVVLSRGERWTQIQTQDGTRGWIPIGFLEPQPPPVLRVEQLEAEVETLRKSLDENQSSSSELAAERERLVARDTEREAELRRLTAENLDLKAGERWPYLITGASILAAGMILGALLQRTSGRRQATRIRF